MTPGNAFSTDQSDGTPSRLRRPSCVGSDKLRAPVTSSSELACAVPAARQKPTSSVPTLTIDFMCAPFVSSKPSPNSPQWVCAYWTAANAMTTPRPESRSKPGAIESSAVAAMAFSTCAGVQVGRTDRTSAAMPAACGAAADVPKNGRNPGVFALVPSAAVMSGLARVIPPLVPNRKLPGVIGEPLGLKKILRGPSELKASIGFAAPVNGRVPVRALFQ